MNKIKRMHYTLLFWFLRKLPNLPFSLPIYIPCLEEYPQLTCQNKKYFWQIKKKMFFYPRILLLFVFKKATIEDIVRSNHLGYVISSRVRDFYVYFLP